MGSRDFNCCCWTIFNLSRKVRNRRICKLLFQVSRAYGRHLSEKHLSWVEFTTHFCFYTEKVLWDVSVCPFVRPSVCLSVGLSVCLYVTPLSTAALGKPYVQWKYRKPDGTQIGNPREASCSRHQFLYKIYSKPLHNPLNRKSLHSNVNTCLEKRWFIYYARLSPHCACLELNF
jgi:hypothetical protein